MHTPVTFGQFLQRKAEQYPDTVILRFIDFAQPDDIITYSTLFQRAHTLAVVLQQRGITRGVTFGVMMQNHAAFVYALAAASLLGAILVPIDPRAHGTMLQHQLSHAACRAILVADYALARLVPTLTQLPDLHTVLLLHTNAEAAPVLDMHWPSLNAILAEPAASLRHSANDPTQAVEILYTSGTTRAPRGVVIDNRRLLDFRLLGKVIFGYRPDDRLYTGLSLAHGNAQAVTLMGALGQGIEAVFTRRFTRSRLWDITRTYGITTFALLGGMATTISSAPVRPDDDDNPVRMVVSAGMPVALWESFERRFNVRILEWYAAAEGGLVYKPVGEGPIGSFGRLSPGHDLRVVDTAGNDCPPGAVGELLFRPLNAPARVAYWRDPEATAHKVQAGWLHSGDMVSRDAEGYCFFHHRQGDAIRRNGAFVDTAAIIAVLAAHPAINDVFVYGIPALSGAPGEQDIVAAIVPTEQGLLNRRDLVTACHSALPANAVPSYIQTVSALPKTLSEKPLKRLLMDHFNLKSPDIFPMPGHDNVRPLPTNYRD